MSMRTRFRLLSVSLVVGGAAYLLGVRPRIARWGATDEEVVARLPGDEIVPEPDLETTRAVTIRAPAERVFPWLAQLGQGRGGFYSYDRLENAPVLHLDIHSADRILPEHQDLRPGDRIPIAPEPPFYGYIVEEARPPTTLVLRTRMDPFSGLQVDSASRAASRVIDSTWAFALRPAGAGATRLIARNRMAIRVPPGLGLPYRLGLEVVYFAMERKMLLGVQDRAGGTDAPAPGGLAPDAA